MAHESAAAEKAIKTALAADSALAAVVGTHIYGYEAPPGTPPPYVLFESLPGKDTQGVGTKRQMAVVPYVVRVVCLGSPTQAPVQTAAKRIDEVIGKMQTRSVTDANGDAYQVSARREGGPLSYRERDPKTNVTYYHVGGRYKLYISAA